MNILMMTNTYKPILGGLEKSVESFARELRLLGHRVIIIAPEYKGSKKEEDVIRIPAVQNFNGSDFSVQLPMPGVTDAALGDFKPDIVHAHHPFLIGDTALRVATKYNVPLVFTHHTLYEQNVHYVPGNEEALKRFVIELSTGYCNLADRVIAPSESVMRLIQERGVKTPVDVVPTGIYGQKFRRGAGKAFRKKFNIPTDAFVLGHLGRLAPEKNLEFLSQAAAVFLKKNPKAHVMIAGKGPSEEKIREIMTNEGVVDRLHLVGVVKGQELINAYRAMDIFLFASQSETQGMVLTEAMAAGIPVVAVDAPGAREVVEDTINGRIIPKEDLNDFVAAIEWMAARNAKKIKEMKAKCWETADKFSMKRSVDKISAIYVSLIVQGFVRRSSDDSPWGGTIRMLQTQWGLVKNLTKAAGVMMMAPSVPKEEKPELVPEPVLN